MTQDRDAANPGKAAGDVAGEAAGDVAGEAAGDVAGEAAGDTAGEVAGDEPLSELFWSVARRLRGVSQDTLAPWDITPGHFRALRVLSRSGTMRLSELSDHLRIAPRSTTEVADALESRGLIQRRPDPGDRRATLVELTTRGASVLAAIRASRGTEADQAFSRLSPADRDQLARILRQLRD